MANQVLKDNKGHKIGIIKEISGKLVIFDAKNHRKGVFNPKTNATHDARNHRVGTGNLLTSLL